MGIIDKLKEIRNKRNERIDAIRRVEEAVKSQGTKTDIEVNKEAQELSEKLGIKYEDAVIYIKHNEIIKKRDDKIKGIVHDILVAGKKSAMNIEQSGFFGDSQSIMKNPDNSNDSFLDFSRIGNESVFNEPKRNHNRPKKHKNKQIVINLR